MDPKSLHATILLLATLVLFTPTVQSCVNLFIAQGQTSGVDWLTWLDGKLWDGEDGSFTQYCTLSSNPPYNFNCDAGYSAVFNSADQYTDTVSYSTPGGSWTFETNYTQCGGYDGIYCSYWKPCRYNCASQGDSDCFVYDCGVNHEGCHPGFN